MTDRSEQPDKLRNSTLQQLVHDVKHINRQTEHLVQSLSLQQLTWQPAPNDWSIAEVYDHLVVTADLYYPKIADLIERTKKAGLHETGPYRPGLFGRLFIYSMSPRSSMKIKTFKIFEPRSSGSAEAISTFLQQQELLLGFLVQADGLNLNRLKLTSPLTRLIRLSLGEALSLMVSHQQLHWVQIDNVQHAPAFPRTRVT